jgi:hypothetical protein
MEICTFPRLHSHWAGGHLFMFSLEALGRVDRRLDLDKVDEVLRVGFTLQPQLVFLHLPRGLILRIEIIAKIIEMQEVFSEKSFYKNFHL